MKKLYPIEIITNSENTVYLPTDFKASTHLNKIVLGALSKDATIQQHKKTRNTVGITSDLFKNLLFPSSTSNVHLFADEETLYIGPLVGIFTSGFSTIKVRPIGERSILFSKLLSVQKTVGVIAFLFGEQHINWEAGTINGLFYEDGWKSAEVPFPNVVYDRIPNRRIENLHKIQGVKNRLQKEYSIPWYNPGFFNKLDIYERLLQDDSISDYLPETHALTNFTVIERMLSNFGNVYIKPKNGSLGKGIYQLLYDIKDGYYYTRFKDLEQGNRLMKFDHLEALINHLFENQNLSHYIVQQGIHLIRSEKKSVDFRVHTNKDKDGNWEMTAIAAKIAGAGSVTTHLNNGGTVKAIEELADTELQSDEMIHKLTKAALQLSKALENQMEGYIGEIGFDLGLDRKGRVWLFEANAKPGRSIFKHPSLRKFDLETRRKSLEYAVYLMDQSIKSLEDIYQ
ncbi:MULTISPECIES: YheC/YheD family protein [Niallia]|uniref:YheC/YheD family protein n=1 Tax=Niallia alba TaxID=2729105 RepID=A0A7Y0PLE3_9BACI|nr:MULTISPECIES: YheC/YheD family protein [Niallia]NMO76655.1 YheC/YheD family protein [Niallia alba]UTI44373.1 YheC/YheD family protein [Niallia sp. RD1]